MNLKTLINQTMFNDNGIFCRTDMPIRMLAVHKYVETGRISNLWWRMQYGKLWFNWGKYECDYNKFLSRINHSKSRLTHITSMFKDGMGEKLGPIMLGNNYALIDGSHRLSCYVYFNIQDVPINIKEGEAGYRPEGENNLIREWYTDSEWETINIYKNHLVSMSGGEKWTSPTGINFDNV